MDNTARRVLRRLFGERATVMLEFAFVAPLAIVVAVYTADIMRILRTEQQLEIATRLAADVEAHMADYYAGGKTPGSAAKNVAKCYLVDVAHVAEGIGDVYIKGDSYVVKNFISLAVDELNKFMKGQSFSEDNVFFNLLGKILGGLMNFVTFRTVNYVTDIIPHDRAVKISTAVYIPTVLPPAAYSAISLPQRGGGGGGRIGVGQFTADLEGGSAATAWSLKINDKKRHRVYCYMPVMDSVPVAPETYVRKFKSWCAKHPFLKKIFN